MSGTECGIELGKDGVKDTGTSDTAETAAKAKVGAKPENGDTKCESRRMQQQPQLQHGKVAEQGVADIID